MKNCIDCSEIYALDLFLCNKFDIIFHRKVPVRTLLFFIVHFERIEYWLRKKWIEEICRKLCIPNNKVGFKIELFLKVFFLFLNVLFLLNRRNGINAEFHIDKYWDNLVNEFVHRSLELETEMWKLSTLGGAFSSVGFFDEHFVERVLRVSIRQLQIAKMLGNEILIARCHLYISLGLAQRRHFRVASKIVRKIWKEGKKLNSELLKNCAQGVWITIKWIRAKDNKALFYCEY